MFRRLLFLLPAGLFAACTVDLATPPTMLDGLPDGLVVNLTLDPDEVGQHGPVTAHLDLVNTTTDTIEIVTAHGCLFTPRVMRDGKRIPFQGSAWGCTAAIATHVFAPGEQVTSSWKMKAELYAENPGDREGAPAPKGTYIVQAEFGTGPVDQQGGRPVVGAVLQVR